MILRLAKDVLEETEAAADRHRLPRAPYVKLNPFLTLTLLNTGMLVVLVLMLVGVLYPKVQTGPRCEAKHVGEAVSMHLVNGDVVCATIQYKMPDAEILKFQKKGKTNG